MILRISLLALWALMSACSASAMRIQSRALAPIPEAGADRLIIAAVDNDPAAFLSSAGSTPHGYDSIAAYGPTSRARRILRSLENDYGLREVNDWPIEPLKMHCAVLRIPENADRAELLAKMSSDPRVKLAQPLQTFSTRSTYNDPYVDLQRGFQRMNVLGAHAWTRGEGVKVGIVDTGADTEHPDLRGRIAAAANFVDGDEARFRRDRHGTEMAGVIAAVANNHEGIVGIAPGARLLIFKACRQLQPDADAATCNSFTLARALVAALDAHVQVVNMSLNGPDDRLLGDLVEEGVRRGVVFVGAAGASALGEDGGLTHRPGMIEVAASEMGADRDFAVHAPGREILTLLPGGRYDFASGDSIATAQVSGVAALLLARNAELTPAAVAKLLRQSASSARMPVAASAPDGIAPAPADVDACEAVIALIGHGSCQPASLAGPPSGGEQHAQSVTLH